MPILKKIALLLNDIIVWYISLSLTLILRYGSESSAERIQNHLASFSILLLVWLVVFYVFGNLYKYEEIPNPSALIKNLIKSIVTCEILSVLMFYAFTPLFGLTPKTNLILFGVIFFVLAFFTRRFLLQKFKSNATPIVIIGESALTSETTFYLEKNPQVGYKVLRHMHGGEATIENILELQKKNTVGIPLVVIENELTKTPAILNLTYHLLPLHVKVIQFSDFYELLFSKVPIEAVNEEWFVKNITSQKIIYDQTKRILEIITVTLAGIIVLPFGLLAALAIKTTSYGPIFFLHQRIGKNNSPFTLYKFRTMVSKHSGQPWTDKNDSRITLIGKILRFTHFDETPQLWNIIRGDISLIGPRPESKELSEKYSPLPHYHLRHVIKPGLTGWAQVNYPQSTTIEEAFEKLKYDIYYIKNRSFILDSLVILKTIKYLTTPNEK